MPTKLVALAKRNMATRSQRNKKAAAKKVQVTHPSQVPEENSGFMTRVIHDVTQQNAKGNTQIAYDPKKLEFRAYCDYKFSAESHETRYTVTAAKVYPFIWYQSMREKRATGGKRKRGQTSAFDSTDFDAVLNIYKSVKAGERVPEPNAPVGPSLMGQYKAAIMGIHQQQVASSANSESWDLIWTLHCQKVMENVGTRESRINKKNHKEKLDHDFAPYTAVEDIPKIEEALWNSGRFVSDRIAFASLRNRYCFLQTLCGILRGESVYNAELSDMLGISVKNTTDPHSIFILVMQLAFGKTNKGKKLFGRIARHKDVRKCGVGALAFYLLFRFELTGEFDSIEYDLTDNKDWFDVKLLVDAQGTDYKKSISNKTYADAMKAVLKQLGIASSHYVHFGRVVGAIELELLEMSSDEIRQLGNWDPSTQEKCYSSKLPMKGIRGKASFIAANGMYFNPRTVLEPPDDLKRQVFPFLEKLEESLLASSDGETRYTALHFVRLLKTLRSVALQDAAVMFEFHPERRQHQLFKRIKVFSSDGFKNYCSQMRAAISAAESPFDANVHAVLPGVNERLTMMVSEFQRGNNSMREEFRDFRNSLSIQIGNHIQFAFSQSLRNMAAGLQDLQQPYHTQGFMADQMEQRTEHEDDTVASTSQDSTTMMVGALHSIPAGFGHSPMKQHTTIASILAQWYGRGSFNGVPIDGGLAAMETKHKNAWRRHFNNADSVHFSRMLRVAKAVRMVQANHCVDEDAAISRLEPLFVSARKKLSTFVDRLKEQGFLETRTRS